MVKYIWAWYIKDGIYFSWMTYELKIICYTKTVLKNCIMDHDVESSLLASLSVA